MAFETDWLLRNAQLLRELLDKWIETAPPVFFFSATALGTTVLLFALTVLYSQYFSPLSKIDGPFWASLTRLWLVKHSRDGDMHRVILAAHKRYGSLVRTGPSEVSVADLTAIRKIYGAGTKFRKSDWYSVWQGRRKFDIFPERDEKIHGAQRRLVSHLYSMDSLLQYEDKVDEAIRVFVKRICDQGSHEPVNLGLWVQMFAFDVVGALTFSKRFGFLEAGSDGGQFKILERALRSGAWVGQMPWIYWLNEALTPYIGNRLGVMARHGSVRKFAKAQVDERATKDNSSYTDLLSRFFDINKTKPGEFDDNAVLSMATSNVFGGSDTTAIALRAIIWYVIKNPRCKQKLVDEIKERQHVGALSYPVTLEEANSMPYLQACMYEALRLHPAVGMALPRVVPEGGIEIDGRFMPAGTTVGVNPWVVHRDEAVFGEKTDEFRPERWLGKDKTELERYFFAFGNGARACLGRHISWMEMSKLVPTLFSRFDLTPTDSKAQWTEHCWWFVKQDNVHVRFNPLE
ncbi:cytochrome P450 [Ilyonectria destructans]|nr:cytochrome P450 [Ilyonectria destructans]